MKNKDFYQNYINAFLKQNSKVNLISKNDEKYLWEKHIFDSLSIEKFFDKYPKGKTLLDIGTGGGFPSLPIAITYPEIEVYPLDSIRKKINAITEITQELNLKNVHPFISLCVGRCPTVQKEGKHGSLYQVSAVRTQLYRRGKTGVLRRLPQGDEGTCLGGRD